MDAVLDADAADDGRQLAEGTVGERGEEVMFDLVWGRRGWGTMTDVMKTLAGG